MSSPAGSRSAGRRRAAWRAAASFRLGDRVHVFELVWRWSWLARWRTPDPTSTAGRWLQRLRLARLEAVAYAVSRVGP